MDSLSTLSDEELVQKIKESGCNECYSVISGRHSNLFYRVCQNYVNNMVRFGYNKEDLMLDKDYVLFSAIQRYDNSRKTKFSTWLGNWTRYYCLNKINYLKKIVNADWTEEVDSRFDSMSLEKFNASRPVIDFITVIETLKKTKDNRIVDIFRLRYDPALRKKRTWSKIASTLKLTVQTTIALHRRGIISLKNEILFEDLDIFKEPN